MDAEFFATLAARNARLAARNARLAVHYAAVRAADAASMPPATEREAPAAERKAPATPKVSTLRGLDVGARVCLVTDASRCGVLEALIEGYCSVRFADASRNIMPRKLRVLTGDDAAFELSPAPPLKEIMRQRLRVSSQRRLQPGSRVCLDSDASRRGVLEAIVGGYWSVKFADVSRNIKSNNLRLLPKDAAFELSQAPPSKVATNFLARVSTKRGLKLGTRVCLDTDKSRRGVIKALVGGFWSVRFADGSRNILPNKLRALPDGAAFELTRAPPLKIKKEKKRTAAPQRSWHFDAGEQRGERRSASPAAGARTREKPSIPLGAAAPAPTSQRKPSAAPLGAAAPVATPRCAPLALAGGAGDAAFPASLDGLRVGALVDAQDAGGAWLAASVVAAEGAAVRVHYDGFSRGCDAWFGAADWPCLAPPRSKSPRANSDGADPADFVAGARFWSRWPTKGQKWWGGTVVSATVSQGRRALEVIWDDGSPGAVDTRLARRVPPVPLLSLPLSAPTDEAVRALQAHAADEAVRALQALAADEAMRALEEALAADEAVRAPQAHALSVAPAGKRAAPVRKRAAPADAPPPPPAPFCDTDASCPICYEALDAASTAALGCGHAVCRVCHFQLARLPSSRQMRSVAIVRCPLCRKRTKS
ncbi:hypothetical protein M885DRAFT_538074 [Pelagophyceae sp. CCMP2097]|nr:hypothetical protein M885DRAFT_538074 [Pelagophyceae sp. CCMP2097]